jgi:TolB-like protein/DNA-binding winged helix-turn-helix (wHTH) protein/predicted TPR repeat methyltransferase
MAAAHSGTLRVGDWRVDPALDEISRDGATLKLEPRAMRVLVCLAEHAGQVVSVDDLLDAVWKDVVVTPDSVYQAVAGLRRALGDDTKKPVYIANVLRRGYRLVSPVAPWADAATDSNTEARPAKAIPIPLTVTAASAPSRVRWPWAILAVAAALAIGYPIAERLRPSKHAGTTEFETTTATVGIGEPSVAVLPFVDMSDRKDQEYFADDLSEVLIDRLAMVPGLRVPARTSSFYFKGKQATVPEIAKALGVAHLLEGTVHKSGTTLRIALQLVRAENGYQIWSETFERPLTDVFKIQDEVAGAVVQVLKVSILSHDAMETARTTNIEAYTLYFRAESNVVSNGAADYDVAAEQLRSAVTLDPQFAAAWARLALVTIWKFDVARAPGARAPRGSPTDAACTDARAAADRALKLDAALGAAHRAKGVVLQYCDSNWLAAETEFRRALELQPASSDALRSYAWLALEAGRPAQAIQLAQHALSLDPLNAWSFAALGDALLMAGHFADAEGAYRKAVKLNPVTAGLHALLANTLLLTNKATEAVAEAEREPDAALREAVMLFALDAAGRKGDADRAIAAYELNHTDDPGRIASFYACRHDVERSIKWLRSFAANRQGEYHDLLYAEACFKILESDVRYQALQRKMKAEGHSLPRVTSATSLPENGRT